MLDSDTILLTIIAAAVVMNAALAIDSIYLSIVNRIDARKAEDAMSRSNKAARIADTNRRAMRRFEERARMERHAAMIARTAANNAAIKAKYL